VDEIRERVRKDGVEFISLQFSDLLGLVKEVVIPVEELDDTLRYGAWFDGSSIEGFARIQESDLFLKPDLRTYAIVPWQNEGKTARFICDIYENDGNPFPFDPRHILKEELNRAGANGYVYHVGPEPEFYLLREDLSPIDSGGYFDMSSYAGYSLIKEIVRALKSFGIEAEAAHHEVGRGQYEIDFNYGEALATADRIITLKYAVKKIAQMRGFVATFMPKPFRGLPGNGMHVHQSLSDLNGKNLFYYEEDRYGLSALAYGFMGGQMAHISEICSFLCSTVNSYKRLVSGFEAPVYISWGSMNRSALIRVPRWFSGKEESARIEIRCADPTCNPYLALALMLASGLDGISSGTRPPEPREEDIYSLDEGALSERGIAQLPGSLFEAIELSERSDLCMSVLGNELFKRYISMKKREWDDFKVEVTDWERKRYGEIY
jgi:glutamine synthetase